MLVTQPTQAHVNDNWSVPCEGHCFHLLLICMHWRENLKPEPLTDYENFLLSSSTTQRLHILSSFNLKFQLENKDCQTLILNVSPKNHLMGFNLTFWPERGLRGMVRKCFIQQGTFNLSFWPKIVNYQIWVINVSLNKVLTTVNIFLFKCWTWVSRKCHVNVDIKQ